MSNESAPAARARWVGLSLEGDREQILARYLELLVEAESPLIHAGPAVVEQLTSQLYSVVDAVYGQTLSRNLARDDPAPAAGGESESLSEDIGRRRAGSQTHPSHSLHAASLIFRATLPSLTRRLQQAGDPEPTITAAYALNDDIMRRMSVAAVGYVEHLLARIHTSQQDERRRLSRELHDVAAPAVAVALQNLELSDIYAQDDPAAAQNRRDGARQALLDALGTIRSLSAQSRECVQHDGLVGAIQRDLDAVPTDIATSLRFEGNPDALSPYYTDDLFFMIREAVRNAAEHANPRRILVHVVAGKHGIEARVTDDGTGFDVRRTLHVLTRHVGMDSMHERAALIGAELVIVSQRSGDPSPSAVVDGLPDAVKLEGLDVGMWASSSAEEPAAASGTTVIIRTAAPNLCAGSRDSPAYRAHV